MSSVIAPFGDLAHLEEQITRTEEDIHQQMVFLSNLRTKRNSFSPVSRLPPETLQIIFVHGARAYHDIFTYGGILTSVPSWVNVSYVCSRWRKIALDCATLWSYHFSLSPQWTDQLLLRAKHVPLKISWFYPADELDEYAEYDRTPWWQSVVDRLLENSERIQELRLSLPPLFLADKLSFCAPRLEILEIHFSVEPEELLAITDGDIPILHTLHLFRCPLPHSLKLSKLKTLCILDVHFPFSSMDEFLGFLGCMEDLATLHLKRFLPGASGFLSSDALKVSQKIDLPCLVLLSVFAPLSAVISLLSGVNIPSKARLCLDLLPERGASANDYAPISSFLSQRFSTCERRSSSGSVFRSLVINTTFRPTLTFGTAGLDSHPSSLFGEQSYDVPLMVILDHGGEDEFVDSSDSLDDMAHIVGRDERRIIRDIICSVPLTHVQSLHLIRPRRQLFWREMLGQMDRLRYLKMSNAFVPDDLVRSLVTPAPDNPDGELDHVQDPTLGRMLVPSLEELELYEMRIVPDDLEATRPGYMSKRSLYNTLSTRMELRDRLTLTNCKVTNIQDEF